MATAKVEVNLEFGAASTAITRIRSNDPALTAVDLSGLFLTERAIAAIADALSTNTHLTSLDLSDNDLQFSSALGSLLEQFGVRPSLRVKKLNLSRNKALGDDAGNILVEAAKVNRYLSSVDVDDTDIDVDIRERLAYLVDLNRFPASLKQAAFDAREQTPGVYSIELLYDPSDVKTYNEEAMDVIVEALSGNTQVRSLRVDGCCRGESCLRHLAELFRTNTTLASVSLQRNMLGTESAMIIMDTLRRNPRTVLESIDLRDNEIDDQGARAITDYLRTTDTIKYVAMDGNPITQHVLLDLKNAALINNEPRMLKEVYPIIADNEPDFFEVILRGGDRKSAASKGYLTSLGAATLAEALETNTTVHTVDLADNHITADGAAALGRVLRKNTTITSLDLSGNLITDEGARHLVQGLVRNEFVVQCDVSRCGLSQNLMREIDDVCRLNRQPLPFKSIYILPIASSLQPFPQVVDLSARPQPRGKNPFVDEETFLMLNHILIKQGDPVIQELNLSDNVLGPTGAQYICSHLIARNFNIFTYRLVNCDLDDACVHMLAHAVRVNSKVRNVIVAGNPKATAAARQVLDDVVALNAYPVTFKSRIPLLTSNVSALDEVNLIRDVQANEMIIGDDGVKIVMEALHNNHHVKRLVIQHHNVSNRGVEYVRNLFVLNPTITIVDLSHNSISTDGALAFADLIINNQVQLRELNLSHNSITDDGAFVMLEALHVNNASVEVLESLNFEGNRVSAAILEAIDCRLLALKQPPRFRRVVSQHGPLVKRPGNKTSRSPLSFDSIKSPMHGSSSVGVDYVWNADIVDLSLDSVALCDPACEAFVRTIKLQQAFLAPTPASITRLKFDGQKITTEGAKHLCEAVRTLQSVERLSLANTLVTADAAPYFIAAARDSPNLKMIDLTGTPLSDDTTVVDQIDRVCRANRQSPEFRKYLDKLASLGMRYTNTIAPRAVDCDDDGLKLILTTVVPTQEGAGPVASSSASSPRSTVNAVTTSRFFHAPRVPVQMLAFGHPPASALNVINISGNPRISDHGVAFMCQWLLAAAPVVQEISIVDTGMTASGVQAIKDFVWASSSVLSVEAVVSDSVKAFFKPSDREAHDSAVDAAIESINTKLPENADLNMQNNVTQSINLRMSFAEKECGRALETAQDVLDQARGGDDPDSLRRQADSVLEDALRMLPKRAPYTRGKYRARVEASIAAGRTKPDSL